MKSKVLYALMLSFLSIDSSIAKAQQPTKDYQEISKQDVPISPTRPRKPSAESIGFIYEKGVCSFILPDYVESIKVKMEDEQGLCWEFLVFSTYPNWQIDITLGEYFIECKSNDDSIFSGYIWIE